jgi:hypothetical protein
MALLLTTAAFASGKPVPVKYTRDGDNLSPPLSWSGVPADAASLVLIVVDPDAPGGTFGHWGVFDLPRDCSGLAEGAGADAAPGGGKVAVNDFGDARYDGPEPPRGHGTHHYHFRLAALDVARLALPPRPSVAAVWRAARGHVLASAEIVGTYAR